MIDKTKKICYYTAYNFIITLMHTSPDQNPFSLDAQVPTKRILNLVKQIYSFSNPEKAVAALETGLAALTPPEKKSISASPEIAQTLAEKIGTLLDNIHVRIGNPTENDAKLALIKKLAGLMPEPVRARCFENKELATKFNNMADSFVSQLDTSANEILTQFKTFLELLSPAQRHTLLTSASRRDKIQSVIHRLQRSGQTKKAQDLVDLTNAMVTEGAKAKEIAAAGKEPAKTEFPQATIDAKMGLELVGNALRAFSVYDKPAVIEDNLTKFTDLLKRLTPEAVQAITGEEKISTRFIGHAQDFIRRIEINGDINEITIAISNLEQFVGLLPTHTKEMFLKDPTTKTRFERKLNDFVLKMNASTSDFANFFPFFQALLDVVPPQMAHEILSNERNTLRIQRITATLHREGKHSEAATLTTLIGK